MKARFVVFIVFFILSLSTTGLPLTTAFACELLDETRACVIRPRTKAVLPLVAQLPSGTSPSEARTVPNAWQDLEPHGTIWYKTDYSANFRLLEYWLETNRPDVANFAVYSPQQSDGLGAATKPVGRGTHNKNDPDDVIRWKAGYAWPGVWYVLLTNNTDAPISYKLNHNQESVPVKNCISYWELVQGVPTYWTDCGFYTGPH